MFAELQQKILEGRGENRTRWYRPKEEYQKKEERRSTERAKGRTKRRSKNIPKIKIKLRVTLYGAN